MATEPDLTEFGHLVGEVDIRRKELESDNHKLQEELEQSKKRGSALKMDFEAEKREHKIEVEDLKRKHKHYAEDAESKHQKETRKLQDEFESKSEKARRDYREEMDRLEKQHHERFTETERRLRAELDALRSSKDQELSLLQQRFEEFKLSTENKTSSMGSEAESLRLKLSNLEFSLDSSTAQNNTLRAELETANDKIKKLDKDKEELQEQVELYKYKGNDQVSKFEQLFEERNQGVEREEALRKQILDLDNARRRLHAEIQDMKGNIRVFCRVRPRLQHEDGDGLDYRLPDGETDKNLIDLDRWKGNANGIGKSWDGKKFKFDRVFGPESGNSEIFGEISQLVQSALDGYNVCIFAYGQTGSGKTYTMLNEKDGMIPKAVEMIYNTSKTMEQSGWAWTIRGHFIEIYCEKIKDLLNQDGDEEKKSHEVVQEGPRLVITDLTDVIMTSTEEVTRNIKQASASRTTASTNMNLDSSRSHSVVILRLHGVNNRSGEVRESSLCLVDLAGSENVEQSGNHDQRKVEAKNINLSLSNLRIVMRQLKDKEKHVSFRDSKVCPPSPLI